MFREEPVALSHGDARRRFEDALPFTPDATYLHHFQGCRIAR